MYSVVLWSDTDQGPYCREVQSCGIFGAIFVPASRCGGLAYTVAASGEPGGGLIGHFSLDG